MTMSFKRPSHTFDIALIIISLSSSFISLVQLFQTSNMYRTTKSQYAQTNPNKIVSQGVRERDLGGGDLDRVFERLRLLLLDLRGGLLEYFLGLRRGLLDRLRDRRGLRE